MGVGCLLVNEENSFFMKREKMFVIIVLILCVISILTTISISSLFALLFGVVVAHILTNRVKSLVRFLLISVAVLLAVYIFDSIANIDLIGIVLLKTLNQTEDGIISSGRMGFFANAFDKWLSSPVLGVGFGDLNYGLATSSAHNTFLTILSQQGILGFLLHFMLLIVIPFADYLQHKVNRNTFIVFYLPLFSVIIQSLGYDLLYKLDTFFVLLALFIASFILDSRNADL